MSGETEKEVSGWTVDTLHSHIEALNDGIRDYINSQFAIRDQRLLGMDRATEVLNETITRVPTDLDEAVSHLREITDLQFQSIDKQMKIRDDNAERKIRDDEVALEAAFKAQQDAACVSADTPILGADLIWRPAGDLLPGDQLLAFDEETADGSRGRRYRKATVTANSLERAPLLLINTARGSVRCTYDHPVLVKRGRGRAWLWTKAEDLRPNMLVMHVLDVWDVDRSYDGGWMAGILDGEGCVSFKQSVNNMARLTIGQVPGLVADKIDEAFKSMAVDTYRWTRPAIGVRQQQIRWQVDSRADIMRLLGSLRPARLLVHSDQIWEGFTVLGLSRSTATTITSVESAGTGVIASLSTSTKTYIAGGFASHNTEQNKSNTLAIDKSEKSTKETADGIKNQIEELKKRLNGVDQAITGIIQSKAGGSANLTQVLAVIAAAIAAVAVLYAILKP